MPRSAEQVLTVAQMRAAEDALIAAGISVDELMQRAGCGAAEYVWRIAAHGRVTVLCGPGNNGGDGYVIAESIRAQGGRVRVIAASEPKTDAARNARSLYQGEVLGQDADLHGEVFVDCLFGSGLARPLAPEHVSLLAELAVSHRTSLAIDVPSGVDADRGLALNEGLPAFDMTLVLGAWKPAHFLMPACAAMGGVRLVEIGVEQVPGAAHMLSRPAFAPPAPDAHKYRRGMLVIVGGAMPGAALLAAHAAQGAGAGYVRVMASIQPGVAPADLVVRGGSLPDALSDPRYNALLVGPGLGRGDDSRVRLNAALAAARPVVLDADALMLLTRRPFAAAVIATPHEGEMAALEATFGCSGEGTKPERAIALARAAEMIVVAKGPDTVIAAPDGRLVFASRASSWLSVAGTGDVLAGTIASRLATGRDPFQAACEGVWLHGEAARLCCAPFTASQLAKAIALAFRACL